jgi:hypothetical protein
VTPVALVVQVAAAVAGTAVMLVVLVIPHPQAHHKVATEALEMVQALVELVVAAAALVQQVLLRLIQMVVMEALEQLLLLQVHQ